MRESNGTPIAVDWNFLAPPRREGFLTLPCLFRVKSCPDEFEACLPLYPEQRTSLSRPVGPFVAQAATVGAVEILSFEMMVQKLVQAVTCIIRCRAIVFQSVIKNHPAGLELRVVESMERSRINDELD